MKKYCITALVSLVIAGAVFLYQASHLGWKAETLFRLLSDGCSVSGILLLCAGALCLVSNEGGLDALAYVGHRLRWRFDRGLRETEKKVPDYFTFVQGRRERGTISFGHLLLAGGVMLAAGILLALFA